MMTFKTLKRPTLQTHSRKQEDEQDKRIHGISYSGTSKLLTPNFYLLGTFWKNFSKIDSPVSCSYFINKTSLKIEDMKFLF